MDEVVTLTSLCSQWSPVKKKETERGKKAAEADQIKSQNSIGEESASDTNRPSCHT